MSILVIECVPVSDYVSRHKIPKRMLVLVNTISSLVLGHRVTWHREDIRIWCKSTGVVSCWLFVIPGFRRNGENGRKGIGLHPPHILKLRYVSLNLNTQESQICSPLSTYLFLQHTMKWRVPLYLHKQKSAESLIISYNHLLQLHLPSLFWSTKKYVPHKNVSHTITTYYKMLHKSRWATKANL